MYDLEPVAPGRYDLAVEITRKPTADPVQYYLDELKSPASVATMEQALGVVVSLLAGAGRPDNGARQAREDRKTAAQATKAAAHTYDWFAFDSAKAKQLIMLLTSEGYAVSSQNKMAAAVVGTLKQVTVINVQEQIDAQGRLADAPMTIDDKLKANQALDMLYGRRALITQSALAALAKFEPKAPAEKKAPAPPAEQPQRKRARRSDAIDRTTKGASKHRQLSKREMRAIWAVCAQNGKKGVRDMAIIALGFGCGLRRAEIAALQFGDIEWEGKVMGQGDDGEESRQLPIEQDADDTHGVTYLPITIRHGKGDKKRIVNASNGARLALLQWKALRGDAPGPLLYSWHQHKGMQAGKPIDSQVIYSVCDELATRAGIRKFSPHDMRRSFVSGFLEATGDLAMAAQLAGHANVQTTMRYDVREEDAKAAAAIRHVSVPFEPVTVQTDLA